MLSVKSFFKETFFISGSEGIILFAMCIAAVVLLLVATALAIAVIVALRRRKREGSAEDSQAVQTTPAEQAEQAEIAEQTEQPLAETSEEAEETPEEPTEEEEVLEDGGTRCIRSFTARLIQSGDEVKEWYGSLKNALLGYKKVRARMSWRRESFHSGRKVVARLGYRGNTLCVYLPLDPAEYADSKYKVEDVSDYAAYADTPCMYRIKNERRARYAAELIAVVMNAQGIVYSGREAEDYYLPYEETEALIEKGLIKIANGTLGQIISQDNAVEEVAAETAVEVEEEQPAEDVAAETTEEEQPAEAAEEVPQEQPVEEAEAEEEAVTETTEEQPSEKAEEDT